MEVIHQANDSTYTFKAGARRKTHFLFLPSDLSTFGDPVKKPMKVRGNFRKCTNLLLENELNEFTVILKNGEYFEIGCPVLSRGRTRKDIENYCGMYKKGEVKTEPPRLEVQVTVPPGNGVKVYSIEDKFYIYLLNEKGVFTETYDFRKAKEVTGTPL